MLRRKSEFFDNNFQLINNSTKNYIYNKYLLSYVSSKKEVAIL